MANEKLYWIGFSLAKGIGAVRFRALLKAFGNLETAWGATDQQLRNAGLSEKNIENLRFVKSQKDLNKIQDWLQKQEISVLTWNEDRYPKRLLEIHQPPPVLYMKGTITPEDYSAVAIVGTRRISAYGRQVTEQVAEFLAAKGFTVVSGLARGVDGLAHQTALRAGGRTLAVLGCGVEQVYPPEHRKLAEDIIHQGALLSDYPPGTKPEAINFPPRNRIISGLAKAVIVVEAGESSGTLITANFAADQGRDVLAVPGSIFSAQSKGTNQLIGKGAIPYLGLSSLEEVLDIDVQESQPANKNIPGDGIESQLYQYLKLQGECHVDELAELTGLGMELIVPSLTMMELKGVIIESGNLTYQIRER